MLKLRLLDLWANIWRWVLMAAGAVIAAYLLLDRGVANGVVTAAAIGLLVIGAALTGRLSMAIPLMAIPGLFVIARAGIGGTDLAVSDVALAAAFGTAVLLGERPYSRPLRQLLVLNLIYQFTTLFTVIVNPYAANTVEWFHAWLLVSGALIVGWAVGAAGYARLGLTLMLIAACGIALSTVVTGILQYAGGNFTGVYPAFPWGMHKNFAGCVMAFMALVVYANPDWVGWRRDTRALTFWFLVIGIVMTQSRQAAIGFIVGLIIVALRGRVSGRSKLVLLLIIPAVVLVITTVIEQIDSQNRFNSLYQRLDWFREVYALWKHSPIFGHGLRYWYTDTTAPFQPPQAELEVLASAGVVGLAGFIVMWVGVLVVLWRVDRRFGALALAVTASRIVQAQFDLFWVAAQVSIPFVIAGICLGAQAYLGRRPHTSWSQETLSSPRSISA
ncbi:hypothetical protein GCM10022200_18440 [Microbacterium awajiense]|uniref:O-antigen ligase-related domain-containing protein n=1 Tax=Microbacterium awajiense TaxID=415214 RepID=A0ABP7AM16_9MICO